MGVFRHRSVSRIRRLRSRWIPSVVAAVQVVETVDNTGTASFLLTSAEAQNVSQSGSASLALTVEATSETRDTSATAINSLELDATADIDSSSGAGTILISDFQTEEEFSQGTGDPTIVESITEFVDNTGTGTYDISDLVPEPDMTNVGEGTQFLQEAIADTIENSATNDPTLIDLETDTIVNTGTGSHFTDGESISEVDTVAFLASQTIDEQRDVVVVPFSDISTGTWTVAPLYEKVDELIVAAGYPTETIRSGDNPSNDIAILGLQPASDPGIDENHFINVEFYKDGAEILDFTVNLKEGSTLIATRTFVNVQETQSSPRRERIALTTNEADDIVNYSNLNIELIANKTS